MLDCKEIQTHLLSNDIVSYLTIQINLKFFINVSDKNIYRKFTMC